MSVVLVAGGGEMTVGRQTATYVYGSFDVVLPEGREQVETDDRLDDGYVYRPSDRPTGRFDTQFVRADVKIDLGAGTSDLEATLDGAQDRVAGDVFFDRDITGPGLGVARPGIDYETGDVVRVVAWGKYLTLPVTAIDMITGTPPWRVHVGGQLISDAAGLRKHNDDIAQQIAAEKRQRLREVGEVRSTATTAVTQAAELREVLAGPAASDVSLLSQLAAINAQVISLGGQAQPGLLGQFIQINTQLWQQQQAINEQARLFREQQATINAQTDQILGVVQENLRLQEIITTGMPRIIHIDTGQSNMWTTSSGGISTGADFGTLEFFAIPGAPRSGAIFRASPGWEGTVLMIAVSDSGSSDVTSAAITSTNRRQKSEAGGVFGNYKSATVFIFPAATEK